jgi:glycine cleavage system aminomethyltransferase T
MPAIRQTPLFHAHQRAGASLTEHHGWQVPAHFTGAQKEAEQLSKSAGLGDVSWMTKLDLKGYGLKTAPAASGARAWCLGPQHYLITCDPAVSESVLAALRSLSQSPAGLSLPPPVYITDATSVYAQFLLAGPRSREILRKLTSLNVSALANLNCGQASLAHVHGTVLRDDLQDIPAFHILVSREYGERVWEAILHAGHEFHLAPFGLKALEFLGGRA